MRRSPKSKGEPPDIRIHPLTPRRWNDLVELFGERGACEGCWCMYWRQPGREHWQNAGQGNKRALKAIVDARGVPGLLAYAEGRPIGWCSVAPREEYGRLSRSPTVGPIDDKPAWSVVCFYVDRKYRRKGVSQSLLQAAVDHAAKHGARLVEGYPVDPRDRRLPGADAYTGVPRMFLEAGFKEVARRSRNRPIMRFRVPSGGRARKAKPE